MQQVTARIDPNSGLRPGPGELPAAGRGRVVWHIGWAAVVVGALGLNAVWPLPGQEDGRPWAIGMMAYPVAAALLLIRRPGNRVGMLLATVGGGAGLTFIGGWVAFEWAQVPATGIFEALGSGAVVVMFWGAIALLYVFPTGRPASPGSRRVFVWITATMALLAVLGVFSPAPLVYTGRANPLGGPEWLATIWDYGSWILPVAALGGLWSVGVRYRRAGEVERSQLKWLIAAGLWFLLLVGVIGQTSDTGEPSRWDILLVPVVIGAFWALPTAVLVAVLRYRLYDIDRLVSRTLTYVTVVAMLGGLYAGTVWTLSRAFPANGDLAVSASTLAAAAALNPLRRRVQHWVDRYFNRTRFDVEAEMDRYAARVRTSADLAGTRSDFEGVVARTIEPASVSLWLREDPHLARPPSTRPVGEPVEVEAV